MSNPLTIPLKNNPLTTWTGVALLAHTFWGMQPVFSRYLQTISGLPGLSILGLANFLATLILLSIFAKRLEWHYLRSRTLWFFAIIVAIRGSTNLLSTGFTLAIYVQVVMLMTPFLVAFLSFAVLREALPRYTKRSIVLATTGALLMIGGNLQFGKALTTNDLIGLSLALFSSFFLATYMILVRRTEQNKTPAPVVMLVQTTTIAMFSFVTSWLIGEDWNRWTEIGQQDWLIFGTMTLLVYLGANVCQVTSIQHVGASLVGTLLPWRLVIALILAAVLVGEYLTSIWQVMGASIVFLTLSWYLWQQRPPSP